MWRASCVTLQWANWNVRTLYSEIHIREDGTVKLTGKEPQKIDELCTELGNHNITLAAISEHRWRGEGTYSVNEHWKFIYSGLPTEAPKAQSGVGFLVHSSLWGAWRDAGEYCHAQGARLIKIRLRIAGRFFSVVSVYAPTFQCSDAEKDLFCENLTDLVTAVDAKDELIIMGDFNARMGVKDTGEDEACGFNLRDVVGTHGLPEINENGSRLLEYCASQRRRKSRVMSTCFQRKEYGTWFHPSSRKWFQIDHVLCSSQTGGLVKDVKAMVGYEHNTDHRCIKVKLRIPLKMCIGRFYNIGGAQAGMAVHHVYRLIGCRTAQFARRSINSYMNLRQRVFSTKGTSCSGMRYGKLLLQNWEWCPLLILHHGRWITSLNSRR